jgi:DNA ligase-1
MTDLADGESTQVSGSGSSVYTIRNIGGVYSCSCPAWRNQSTAIESRTCKHIRKLRGDAAEEARIGGAIPIPARKKSADGEEGDKETPVLLAEPWDGVLDVTGWWLSEKLDGVRAYWDGKQFLSRLGNVFVAPEWFIAGLPNFPLDGELWLERKQFQRTVSIVRRKDQSDHWKQIRYVVFDAPELAEPFEARMEHVHDLLRKHSPEYATPHEQSRCLGTSHLQDELARIEALGGEGLMLRQPESKYVVGRSSSLLKVKRFHDAEARVIGHQKGAGRHKGRLGALLVQLPDGTEFSVGTGFSDKQREAPPEIGSQITFRYQELSDAGVPRFPSYVGVRQDEPVVVPTAEKSAKTNIAKAASAPEPAEKPASKPASKPSAKAAAATPVASVPDGSRNFEYSDEKSDKFWEITVAGLDVTVRYGRKGTSGQSQTKSFDNAAAVAKHVTTLIDEKVKKGYAET